MILLCTNMAELRSWIAFKTKAYLGNEISMLKSERCKSMAKIPVCVVEDHCDVSTPLDVQTPASGIMRMCGCGARVKCGMRGSR